MKIIIFLFIELSFVFGSFNLQDEKVSKIIDNDKVSENFYPDFIWNFMSNDDFQLARTKINNWECVGYFKNSEYSLHLFPSIEILYKEFEKDLTFEKHFTILNSKKKSKKELVFKKLDDKWFLVDLINTELELTNNTNFESFIYNFSTDITFAQKHIKFPLKYTYFDQLNDVEKTEYIEESKTPSFNFFENGKLMFFHSNQQSSLNQIIIYLRGFDGGLTIYSCFERIENEWVLVEYIDAST